MDRLAELTRRAARYRFPAWTWSLTLVLMAIGAVGSTFFFVPIDPDHVTFMGWPQGPGCGFMELTGLPCPSCGMTRSWVQTTRGHPLTGFGFNPAGALLFWWIVVAGILGGVRLITRNHRALRLPPTLLAAWAIFWLLVPYSLLWLLRLALGWNALPEMG